MKSFVFFNKKIAGIVLGLLLVGSNFIAPQITSEALSSGDLSLSMTTTNSGNGHEGFNQGTTVFSFTNAGAAPNDFMQYVMRLENKNGSDDANNVKISAVLPSQKDSSGSKFAVFVVGSAGIDAGPVSVGATSIAYFDESGNQIIPASTDSVGRDPKVARIVYSFAKIPAGSTGSSNKEIYAQFSVRMMPSLAAGTVVSGITAQSSVSADSISGVSSNQTTVTLTTKPQFNIGPGENNFFTGQPGPDEFASRWQDPVSINSGGDIFLRVLVTNYIYETVARNVQIRVTWPSDARSSIDATAQITSSNTDSVSDTLTLNVSGGTVQNLTLVDGTVKDSAGKTLTFQKIDNGFIATIPDISWGAPGSVQLNAKLRLIAPAAAVVQPPVIIQQPPANITVTNNPTQTLTMNPTQTLTQNPQITVTTAQVAPTQLPKTGFPLAIALGGGAGVVPLGWWLTTLKLRRKVGKEEFLREGLGLDYV